MAEVYVPLEEAAELEGVDYETLKKRVQRNPKDFKPCEEPRENGGKPLKLVALSSLSKKARKAYKAKQKIDGGDIVANARAGSNEPWYLSADIHWYIENHTAEYDQAAALSEQVKAFVAYSQSERTAHAERFAVNLGISSRSLYRHAQTYLEASAWAIRLEKETGRSYEHLTVLSLCRKPREGDTFPSLPPELRAYIENGWFDKKFRANRGTRKLLYESLTKSCKKSGVEIPSYAMVTRYINHLRDKPGVASAEFLAAKGEREWKNKFMMKGERDHTLLEIMEIVLGDEHTFDLFVSYVAPNGQTIAIKPKLIGWLDMRSRMPVSYAMCKDANMQDIKSTVAKMFREYGCAKYFLIDNGRDYKGNEMVGQEQKERLLLDAEALGFYRAMGVQEVHHSLPYEPWSKGQIERSFGTICEQFSKRFDSYVGTLTGSRTEAKIKKNIPRMLERGELFTMEEFFALFEEFIKDEYSQNMHRGLKDEGEQFVTPAEAFANNDRYYKPAPPDSYIAMLMMKSKRAAVRTTGIQFNKRKYMCEELVPFINSHVNIRYMPDDNSIIFAFSEDGDLIGEIPMAEKLNPRFNEDTEQLANHVSKQKRHLRDARETLGEFNTPFEKRAESEGITPRLVGGVNLTIGKKSQNNAVALPKDKQYRQEMNKSKQKFTASEYLDRRADEAFEKLQKLG